MNIRGDVQGMLVQRTAGLAGDWKQSQLFVVNAGFHPLWTIVRPLELVIKTFIVNVGEDKLSLVRVGSWTLRVKDDPFDVDYSQVRILNRGLWISIDIEGRKMWANTSFTSQIEELEAQLSDR